jgi:hypothetical protein
MAATFALIATALCLWSMVVILRYFYLRNTLSPGRFALTFAIGWSFALLIFYFANVVLGGKIQLTINLVGLGLAIGVINFLLSYPLAYFAHKYILSRFLKPPNSPTL